MKLESLKKDKFEAFKENEISNAVNIIGGKIPVGTCLSGNTDHYDYGTKDGHSSDGGGTSWDFYYF